MHRLQERVEARQRLAATVDGLVVAGFWCSFNDRGRPMRLLRGVACSMQVWLWSRDDSIDVDALEKQMRLAVEEQIFRCKRVELDWWFNRAR